MRVPITVVADLGEKPRIHIVPGNHPRAEALEITKAPEGSQVWSELYDASDPGGEAIRITDRAKLLQQYLQKHQRDIPMIDP